MLGLLLAAAPFSAADEPAPPKSRGAVDWVLTRASRAFTSDSDYFGQVHLPVIATNPNSGVTVGVLPVWLSHNARHEIVRLFAPMLTYNATYGAAFSGSYYDYPSAAVKFRAILEKSERSNWREALQYENLEFLDGRASLLLDANLEADGGVQFYGVGPASTKGSEASERLLERTVLGEFGLNLGSGLIAAGGWRVRRTEVQDGPFRAPHGIDPSLLTKTNYSLPRVRLSRDTRDLPYTPSQGSLTEVIAEYSRSALGGPSNYDHYVAQWRLYVPTADGLVTALHAQTEWSAGGDVPFTALAQLGGAHSLRGYPEGRFQDRGMSFANVEERWRVHSMDMLHTMTEFQVAPFLETGTVYRSPGRAQVRYMETVAGVATRAVIKPSIVGKVEIGAGREGPEVYVGIDYPF